MKLHWSSDAERSPWSINSMAIIFSLGNGGFKLSLEVVPATLY